MPVFFFARLEQSSLNLGQFEVELPCSDRFSPTMRCLSFLLLTMCCLSFLLQELRLILAPFGSDPLDRNPRTTEPEPTELSMVSPEPRRPGPLALDAIMHASISRAYRAQLTGTGRAWACRSVRSR